MDDDEKYVEIRVVSSNKYSDCPSSLQYLNDDVNALMAQGWELHGPLQIVQLGQYESQAIHYQPMIFRYFEDVVLEDDEPAAPSHLKDDETPGTPEKGRHL